MSPFRIIMQCSPKGRLRLLALAARLVFSSVTATAAAEAAPLDGPGSASLSGYVVDAQTSETLIAASVVIKEARLGAATNKSGYFSITGIPAGRYLVSVSYLGYERLDTTINFHERTSLKVTFPLRSSSVLTGGVTVSAMREDERREITVSRVNIPVEQLTQIRTGGEADLFRSLQFLPGVLTSSQISSGLYIRGGSPDQNLVLIDGSTVYNPSHLFGFFSTFNPDAVKDVELIKGGYPAEYGGRLSAVVNLTQKDGSREAIGGIASAGLISSRLSLQGPLGNGSWFIGGRRTYLELITALIPEDPQSPFPDFWFYDANGKITQDFGDNDRLFMSGFMSRDQLDYDGAGMVFGLNVGNRTGAVRWNHIFADNLFSSTSVSASEYWSRLGGDQAGFAFKMENAITDYTARTGLEWYVDEDLTVKTGGEVTRFTFEYLQNMSGKTDSTNPAGGEVGARLNIEDNDWVYAGYGQVNYQLTPLLSLQGGIRADYYQLAKTLAIDPRTSVRLQVQPDVAVKLAWGIYHQYLHLAALPDMSFFDTWLPTDSTVSPSRAIHYIAGIETRPWEGVELNLDLYYKTLSGLTELNPFHIQGETVKEIFYFGDGEAYGGELFLQKNIGDFTGWIGYGLGWVNARYDSINGGRTFRPKYDRRHDLKIVGQYHLSDRWDVGATFTFQSGQSYTAASSRFRSHLPGQSAGWDLVVPGERFALRLPPSHQLNASVTYSTTLLRKPLKIMLDVFNVYSHRDIWFRHYETRKDVTEVIDVRLLPIIPTLSVEWRLQP